MGMIATKRRNVKRVFGAGILPPEPERSDLDRAWDLGFYLGRSGIGGFPPSDWPDVLKDLFYDGLGDGERKRDEDKRAEFMSELEFMAAHADRYVD